MTALQHVPDWAGGQDGPPAPPSPEAETALAQIRDGNRFVAVRNDQVATRAATLEAIVDRCLEDGTKLVWIGNPLRSPLTVERFFLQAVGAEADLRVERTPADLAAILVRSAAGAERLLYVVQQPETLDPEARDTIAALAAHLPEHAPRLQFLFCGTTAFETLAASTPPGPALALTPLPSPANEPGRRHRTLLPFALLLLLIALGLVAAPHVLDAPIPAPAPTSTATLAAPAAAAPPMAAPPAEPPAPPATRPATVDTAALRREFDAFLAQRAPFIPNFNASQKDALFQEFLAQHRQSRDRL